MDNIFYVAIMWAGALAFILIGIYARKRKKPMWLWAGSDIPESKIKDVKAYNRANGKMWCLWSIPLWISGIIIFFAPEYSLVIFGLASTIGIGGVAWSYHKIEETYIVK